MPRLSGALTDLESLLAVAGVDSVQQLSAQVHENEDVDMQVECIENGVLIATAHRGTELRFPFTWAEFWSVVSDLERDFGGSGT